MRRMIATDNDPRPNSAMQGTNRSAARVKRGVFGRRLCDRSLTSKGGPTNVAQHLLGRVERLEDQLQRAEADTVMALVAALEARDPYTHKHSINVASLARTLTRRMGLSPDETEDIVVASLLHDIGKFAIPDAILHKPGPLTPDEFEVIKAHPVVGAAMLRPVGFLSRVVPLVLYHHEWYDGTGYPHRLKGDRIPRGARVLQVADSIDAMMTPRSYRRRLGVEEVLNELLRFRGRQFDPAIADVAIDWLSGTAEPSPGATDCEAATIPFPIS